MACDLPHGTGTSHENARADEASSRASPGRLSFPYRACWLVRAQLLAVVAAELFLYVMAAGVSGNACYQTDADAVLHLRQVTAIGETS